MTTTPNQQPQNESFIHQFIAHNLKNDHQISPQKSYELMKLLEKSISKDKTEEENSYKTLVKLFSENEELIYISKEAVKWGRAMKNYYFCKN